MWELNGSWGNEVPTNSLASYHTTITQEVHVLLVDHERESLVSIANMLQMCSYKVTMVELASTALTMLTNGGEKFDIVIANIHSPDYQGFKLLETAVSMDIMTICEWEKNVLTMNEEVVVARRALECGAFLYIKKPVSMELVKYLWQHVVKERLRNAAESTVGDGTDSNGRSTESEEESLDKENSDLEDDRKTTGKRKAKNQTGSDMDNQTGPVKRKACTEWTQELHAKFIDAVTQLGDGRCYPKDILELMNVPGLTRMQVASHLQKCRNDNWKAPEKRSCRTHGSQPNNSKGSSRSKDSMRRFGTMPRLCMNYQPEQPKNQEKSVVLEMNSRLGSKTSANGGGESSKLQSSTGRSSSVQNGGLQLQKLGIFSGISIGGAGNDNEESNGNGNRLPAFVALELNSQQSQGQNPSAFHDPVAGTVINSQANSPSRRQIADDFFEFPEMDYISQNISVLQQEPGTTHGQSQQAYSFNQAYPEQVPTAIDMEARCLEYSSSATNSGNQKSMICDCE